MNLSIKVVVLILQDHRILEFNMLTFSNILVFYCCHNTLLQIEWLNTIQMYLFIVL